MAEFNRLTIVAATQVIAESHSHDDMGLLEVQWDIGQYGVAISSKNARIGSWASIAATHNPQVWTSVGLTTMERALVELAVHAPPNVKSNPVWTKLIAGLRFDGFEIIETSLPDTNGKPSIFDDTPRMIKVHELRRMLPEDVPEADFREAESEIESLLDKHGLQVAKGHLIQAVANFGQGNWSSANAMIRDYYQELLDKIAEKLGCDPTVSDDAKRQFLASDPSGPFLFNEYNEWENDRGRPSYVLGLWARLHPHGSHPGLSDEEDCAFRFQIILVTSRLFLRRFDKRAFP